MSSTADSSERTMILAHYYRAMVGRADVWRTRMDTTTHWAIGATAAIVSFAIGDADVPHYVVFIASLLTLCFLALEARRLTFYHLWQQRVLTLERGLIAPALSPADTAVSADENLSALREALEGHLGRTAPTMPLLKAAARRLRRVYLYLFAVQLLAWALKLSIHPYTSSSPGELVARAHIADVPGAVVLGVVAIFSVACVWLAVVRGRGDSTH